VPTTRGCGSAPVDSCITQHSAWAPRTLLSARCLHRIGTSRDFPLIGMRVGGEVTVDAAGRLTDSSESAVPGPVARRLKPERLLLPAGARVGSP
jgi:hypothetical protein